MKEEEGLRKDTKAVDAADLEVVEQLHCLLSVWVVGVGFAHATQKLDLVERRLRVVLRALHHLERHETLAPVHRKNMTSCFLSY